MGALHYLVICIIKTAVWNLSTVKA